MTLRDYVFIVARHWVIVVATIAVGLLTAGVLAFTATTMYSASAQVLFTGHATTSGQDLAYVGTYVQSRMQTYKHLGTSSSVLGPVAQVIGTDDTTKELAKRTEVDVSQLNTVATVSATDTTAKGAARTANTLAGALLNAVQKLEADNAADPDASGSDKPASATVQGAITSKAEVPSSPSDPDVPLYLLAGALAGLIIGIGVVALREVLLSGEESSPPSGEGP